MGNSQLLIITVQQLTLPSHTLSLLSFLCLLCDAFENKIQYVVVITKGVQVSASWRAFEATVELR